MTATGKTEAAGVNASSTPASGDPALGRPGEESDFSGFFTGPEWQPESGGNGGQPPAGDAGGSGPASSPEGEDKASGLPVSGPEKLPDSSSAGAKASEDDKPMSLMDHLSELRMRLIRCTVAACLGFLACWAVVEPIFNTLVAPLQAVLPPGSHAQYTTLPEGFFTRMYIAFVAGIFASSPVIFYQIWSFIAPGLYDEEKRYIIPIAFLSAIFFVSGGAFCYFIVFPYAFGFFVSFATETIVVTPKISDYLNFVLKLLIAFGLIFEMPLFSFFLSRMGLVTADRMRRVRRYAVLVIFVVAAILTPPDVVSQLLMAGPMILLYELSIIVSALAGPRKKKARAEVTGNNDGKNGETA